MNSSTISRWSSSPPKATVRRGRSDIRDRRADDLLESDTVDVTAPRQGGGSEMRSQDVSQVLRRRPRRALALQRARGRDLAANPVELVAQMLDAHGSSAEGPGPGCIGPAAGRRTSRYSS